MPPIVFTFHDAFGLCLMAALVAVLAVYGIALGITSLLRRIRAYFRHRNH